MISTCLRSGWRAALARPRLIVTLWLWSLMLALVVGFGMSRWLGAALDWSPEADRALERFQFGLLFELTQYDQFSPFAFLPGVIFALVVVAALSNALLAAGVLEVLVSGDERPLLHRFFRGAGHFFGRFLRLSVITAVAGLLVLMVVSAITRPMVNALGESSWERAWIAAGLARWLLLGALVGIVMAILDVARTRVCVASPEVRGMLRAWLGAFRFVLRHFGAVMGIYLVLGASWLLVAAVGLAIVFALPATNWGVIGLLILVQQGFMMARATIRVARAGAIVACVEGAEPIRVAAGLQTGGPERQTSGYTYEDEVIGSTPPP